MRRLTLRTWHFLALFIFICMYKKLRKSSNAMQFLISESEKIDQFDFEANADLKQILTDVPSPAVLMLNQHALNITINFLCNVAAFDHIHERLVIFTFDDESYTKLKCSFPHVYVIRWKLNGLVRKFGAGDGEYQLFQYFRARLAEFLANNVIESFWMIQSDTIWTKNLFEIIDINSDEYASADMIFDAEGDTDAHTLLSSMIAGGYFFVRRGECASHFFNSIANFLRTHFTTDNNLMTKYCTERIGDCSCSRIPYKILSNWRGRAEARKSILFQFDGGESPADKLIQMQHKGLLFVQLETLGLGDSPAQCKPNLPNNIMLYSDLDKSIKTTNNNNIIIRLVHNTFETVVNAFPFLRRLILTEIFPYYAFYVVV